MLEIDLEKICFIVLKARAFDAKVDIMEPDPGSNSSDEDMREVLEDYGSDATSQELHDFIEALNYEEQISLVALTWLGRGDYAAEEWSDASRDAQRAHSDHTAEYLMGIPLLADYLEEGLSMMGLSCGEYEMGRL